MHWVQRVLSSSPNKARAVIAVLALVEIVILLLGPSFSNARAEIAAAAAAKQDVPWEADADAGIHIAAWINLALLVVAEALNQRDRLDTTGDFGTDVAGDRNDSPTEPRSEVGHAADDLALETLFVEVPLAGDDEIGASRSFGESNLVGE